MSQHGRKSAQHQPTRERDNLARGMRTVAVVLGVGALVFVLVVLLHNTTEESQSADKAVTATTRTKPPSPLAKPRSPPMEPPSTVGPVQKPPTMPDSSRPELPGGTVPTRDVQHSQQVSSALGRVEGVLTDKGGKALSGLTVSVEGGPESVTGTDGRFVLTEVAAGDRSLIVKSRSGVSELRHNIVVSAQGSNSATIVYDVKSSRLGLLSIVSPVDDGIVELREDGKVFRAEVFGRCDGLPQILDRFDIWVLIRSERDTRFWVQHPPAVVDPQANSWRADVLLGSPEIPPSTGERWHIVAAAAEADSEMRRIVNTPSLSLLPKCVQSNVVTVVTAKKR